jgi:hypothetical protein
VALLNETWERPTLAWADSVVGGVVAWEKMVVEFLQRGTEADVAEDQ